MIYRHGLIFYVYSSKCNLNRILINTSPVLTAQNQLYILVPCKPALQLGHVDYREGGEINEEATTRAHQRHVESILCMMRHVIGVKLFIDHLNLHADRVGVQCHLALAWTTLGEEDAISGHPPQTRTSGGAYNVRSVELLYAHAHTVTTT